VRHLLTHTSGLQDMAAGRPRGERTTEQLARDLSSAELPQPPGATYQYCNDCFATLGVIVQTVSGQPYEAYVQQQIFAPLEMCRSSFARATPQPGESTGWQWWFGFPLPVKIVERPNNRAAGGIVSNVEDLSHFLIAQLNDGRYGSAAVVSSAGVAEMHQPTVPLPADRPQGLGWARGSIDGVPILSHGGDDLVSPPISSSFRKIGGASSS
jgi:CubicO group peptidase (beta-lactamase class C family)